MKTIVLFVITSLLVLISCFNNDEEKIKGLQNQNTTLKREKSGLELDKSDLQGQVSTLSDKVKTLENYINTLGYEKTDNENTINKMEIDLANANDDIQKLKNEITNLISEKTKLEMELEVLLVVPKNDRDVLIKHNNGKTVMIDSKYLAYAQNNLIGKQIEFEDQVYIIVDEKLLRQMLRDETNVC